MWCRTTFKGNKLYYYHIFLIILISISDFGPKQTKLSFQEKVIIFSCWFLNWTARCFCVYGSTVCTVLLCRSIIGVIEKTTNNKCNSLVSIPYNHTWELPEWVMAIHEWNYLANWVIGKLYCTVLLCMSHIIDFMGFYIMFKNLSLVL